MVDISASPLTRAWMSYPTAARLMWSARSSLASLTANHGESEEPSLYVGKSRKIKRCMYRVPDPKNCIFVLVMEILSLVM